MFRLCSEVVMNGLLEFCTLCTVASHFFPYLWPLYGCLEAQAGLGLGNLLIYLSVCL